MFEQLPAWHSKISLRVAILDAIGFGFTAGLGFGTLLLNALHRALDSWQLVVLPLSTVFALALAIRFYFLAISRAGEKQSPSNT